MPGEQFKRKVFTMRKISFSRIILTARARTHARTHMRARVNTYMHMHAGAHTHTHTNMHMHARAYTCTCTRARAPTHVCRFRHAHTHAHTRTRAHKCKYASAHTHTYTHTTPHTDTHTHTHTHTHALPVVRPSDDRLQSDDACTSVSVLGKCVHEVHSTPAKLEFQDGQALVRSLPHGPDRKKPSRVQFHFNTFCSCTENPAGEQVKQFISRSLLEGAASRRVLTFPAAFVFRVSQPLCPQPPPPPPPRNTTASSVVHVRVSGPPCWLSSNCLTSTGTIILWTVRDEEPRTSTVHLDLRSDSF